MLVEYDINHFSEDECIDLKKIREKHRRYIESKEFQDLDTKTGHLISWIFGLITQKENEKTINELLHEQIIVSINT